MIRPLLLPALLSCPLLVALPLPALAETPAAALAAARPVVTEIVTADPTRERSFPGVIEAGTQSVLAFQTLGRLAELPVGPGDTVRAGDVVAVLDQVTLNEDLAAAQAAVSAAEAAAAFARASAARAEELTRRGVAATAQLEKAQAGRDTAEARLAAARADLTRAEDAARFGHLVAPMDGIVLETRAEIGSVLSAGSPVVVLAALTGREAVIDVPSEFVALLPADARFAVQTGIGKGPVLQARLRLVEPEAGTSLKSRRLRLSLDEVPAQVRLGSLVTASYLAGAAPVMTLPLAALSGPAEAPQVWRVDPASRAVHAVPVHTGKRLGDRVVIADGIAPGEEIVVRGAGSLSEGEIVGARVE